MKNIFRQIIEKLLHFRARNVVRNAETIIGITGSVGKTTTRMAVAGVLSNKYIVQTSEGNFNTPMGMLLSLLNISQTGQSGFGWLLILLKAYFRSLPHPQLLVLEYGVDAPGDMDALLLIATPDIAVITPVSQAHTAKGQFQDVGEMRNEKLKLAEAAQSVIMNGSDRNTVEVFSKLKKPHQKLTIFGDNDSYDEKFTFLKTTHEGITFVFEGNGFFTPVFGSFQVQVFAPAILLGKQFGIAVDAVQKTLAEFRPPPGRGRILRGKNDSRLWDFSYNSSPFATGQVLQTLPEIDWPSRKIALLGSMNELGDTASLAHETLGRIAAECADEIIFVGKYAEDFLRGAGKQKKIQKFNTAPDAGNYLSDILRKGDFVLIKGSQNGVFLEAVVEQLLDNANDNSLLCRRGKHWQKVRNQYFLHMK